MTEVVTAKVAEGIQAIKDSNRCNMADSQTVMKIARQLKYLELAEMIVKDEARYFRCLNHGTAVEEETTAEETTTVEEEVEIAEEATATLSDPLEEESPSMAEDAGDPAEDDTAEEEDEK